jgi:molybdate transport system substrate-binding protein
MKPKTTGLRALFTGLAALVLLTTAAGAAEVRVMISGGLTAAFNALVPEFERKSGNKVLVAYGPSMGTTVNAIPVRLERGEPADVLIMVGYALGDLVKNGEVVESSRVDLVKSPIGVAVKAGAPKPDISSADAVRAALLAARSVAYSDSASGVYVSTEMFRKLGSADEMKDKAKMIPATPVGEIIAKGEAEIGFQQISELKPVKGIDIVGPLPAELQKITVFSAGIATAAKEPEAGKALIKFLTTSPVAKDEIIKSGLDPIPPGATN